MAAAVCAFSLAAATAPPLAGAAFSFFSPQTVVGGNGRAVGPGVSLNKVIFTTDNGDGVDHCAVGKAQSDGGGANVIEPACGTGQIQQTPCVTGRGGYPTGVNRSSSAHRFTGSFYYNGCSV